MFEQQNFEILPWQKEYLQWWQRLAIEDKLPQALLLIAPAGYGKFTLACKFAQLAFCKNINEKIDCDYCDNCKLILSGNYPDLFLLEPKGKNILIEQVRGILDFVNQSGARSARKIIIVRNSESLNTNSANSMLKILEEPPKDTSFIFLAEKPKLLPATILSRLQKLELHQPNLQVLVDWLETKGVENARQKLAENENSPLLALAQTDATQNDKHIIFQAMQDILFKRENPIVLAGQIPKEIELKFLLETMQLQINHFLRYMVLHETSTEETEAFYKAWQERTFTANLVELYAELNSNIARLTTNPNRQLLLENVFVKFAQSLIKQ